MKHTRHWYLVFAFFAFLLLSFLIYRREARLRAYMESMEARLSVLERYNQGMIARNETIGDSQPERNSNSHNKPADRHTPIQNRPNRSISSLGNTPQPTTTAEPTTRTSSATSPNLTKPTPAANNSTNTELAELQAIYSEGKFKEKIRIELNTADSATLVRVPGIGARTALTILNYRDKLGGFYSAEQLREKLVWDYALSYLDEWCKDWFWADEQFVQKLNINKLSFKELARHPYIGYENTKVLFYWRKQHGDIHSRTELEQMGIFTPEKLDQLMHYISF